ncbi:MAG: aminotransferase class I/II-fold pyridoxal phosphate-dependent enzyme [Ignavibacteriota bacterium]
MINTLLNHDNSIHKLSDVANKLSSLSISNIAAKINERRSKGEKIFNLTIGDFDPVHFPIPLILEEEIITAYKSKYTNYPVVGGMPELLESVSAHIKYFGGFDYNPNEIITGSGSRPLTYILFKTLINKGDKVINVVPSWNNYNYVQLVEAEEITFEAKPENNFMVTPEEIKPLLGFASLITFNSPSNPAGTTYSSENTKDIFNLIVEENKRRIAEDNKPLYVFYDIVYWLLTYGNTKFINPVEVCPEIKDYIIFVDGISKCFAATGVRLGWAFGPEPVIAKMKQMIAHIGAWSPKPEQVAVSKFLKDTAEVEKYLKGFKSGLFDRLDLLYKTIMQIKATGIDVDAISPQGALYLSVKLNLIGYKTPAGKTISSVADITNFLLDEAGIAVVPFFAFGANPDSLWFRISVGVCSLDDVREVCKLLKKVTSGITHL